MRRSGRQRMMAMRKVNENASKANKKKRRDEQTTQKAAG